KTFLLQPCHLKDWELHVQFKVHGLGKKNLHGDGFAVWYTKDRLITGTVFGSRDNFHGLGLFIDTYPNDENTDVSAVWQPTVFVFFIYSR
uniref:L-type lectin-like domain-containing protein n=1 Tax=Callorhinchus milii TaxID=7868 RepID=A0A4W3GLD2_CALMI